MKIFNEPYLTFNEVFNGEIDTECQRLNSTFNRTYYRERKQITIDNEPYNVFFRRKEQDTIMFAPVSEQVKTGSQFNYCGDEYLILKSITDTNLIYNRYLCSKCTDKFKIQFSDKVANFDCIVKPLSDSLNSNKNGITVGSTQEFIISLTDEAKKIKINDRFMCGYNGLAYIIVDIAYIDNLCYIYTQRDELQNNDDIENMIANKIDIIDIEPPVTDVGDIIITPDYTYSDLYEEYYELMEYDSQTFTISLNGVHEFDYSVECDNTQDISIIFDDLNTFTAECINGTDEVVIVTITDNVSNKIKEYKIKLVRFM